ncbi:hypothetical protein, partial [Lyngbya sp. CCY1209]|uniref:hypothetical protein n=1 Tax=Lyngbya sp. CCY1209 TaxID=2886103 RepID=UPI002D2132A9
GGLGAAVIFRKNPQLFIRAVTHHFLFNAQFEQKQSTNRLTVVERFLVNLRWGVETGFLGDN